MPTKEKIIGECADYLTHADYCRRCHAFKKMLRAYYLADYLIDVLLNEYNYDFVENAADGFSAIYDELTKTVSKAHIYVEGKGVSV